MFIAVFDLHIVHNELALGLFWKEVSASGH